LPESGSLDIGDAILFVTNQMRTDKEFLFEIALENNALPGIYTFVVANMQNPRLIEEASLMEARAYPIRKSAMGHTGAFPAIR
jgi:hypothetical protein